MVMEKIGKKIILEIGAVLLVVAVAFWSVWPVVKNPARVPDFGKDGEFIIWVINQNARKIFPENVSGTIREKQEDRLGVFDGNIFYPYKNVLAYSEMFWPTSLLVALPVLIAKNPTAAFGWAMAAGQILTMLVVYGWWREMTGNKWAAAVSAIALGLAQFRWHYQVHLQMWGMQWWLLGLWLLWRWLKNRKDWQLYTGAILLGIQAWESVLPVYFSAAIAVVYLAVNFKFSTSKINLKKVVLSGIIAGLIMLPPVLAYRGVSREFNYERSIREAAHNGVSVDEIYPWFGSWGYGVLLAAAIIILITKSKIKDGKTSDKKREIRWMVVVMILGLVMALGPTLKWGGKTVKIGEVPIPLPYAAAYYTVPGFGALRTPSRWIWVFGWAGSGLIAIVIGKVVSSGSKNKTGKAITVAGALIVAVAGGVHLTQYRGILKPENYPTVTKWLSQQEGKVVVYLPMGDENIETDRMLFSLSAGKALINGFSGFMPPERQMLVSKLSGEKWDKEGISELKTLGTDWVVVDKEKANNNEAMLINNGLKKTYSDIRWEVYKW